MKSLNRFKLIGRLIHNRANMAAKHFADVRMDCQNKQKKLEELYQISKEYREKLTSVDLQISAEQFRQYHRFIDYLDYVSKQQAEVVATLKDEVERRRKIWAQFHNQNKELKNYIENVEKQLAVVQLKKEQKELDTTTTDNFIYKNNSDD